MTASKITCPHSWLMIRATKDRSDTIKRLRRIWQDRCAYPDEYFDKCDKHICCHLLLILKMCGKDVQLIEILEMIEPSNGWKIGLIETDPYWHRCVLAVSSVIRQMASAEFIDYRVPAKFKIVA